METNVLYEPADLIVTRSSSNTNGIQDTRIDRHNTPLDDDEASMGFGDDSDAAGTRQLSFMARDGTLIRSKGTGARPGQGQISNEMTI